MSSEVCSPDPVLEVTCQRCGRRTDRVQAFDAPFVLFMIMHIAWRTERIAGCPPCVRTRLWNLFWFSLPAANVFFPIVGPLILGNILASHHGDRPGIPREYAAWANLAPPPAVAPTNTRDKMVRLLVALLMVLAVVVMLFFVLLRPRG